MKNRRGFTLVEVLIVVVIIGILLLIAVPSVQKYMVRGTDEYYSKLEETVMLSGRDYFNDYRALLPKEIGNVTVIELNELLDIGYIEDVVDSKGNKCEAKVTAKKIGKNEYEYYSCLDCGDSYKSKEEVCGFSEDGNITVDTKNYRIAVDKEGYEIDQEGVYIVDQGEEFELPFGKAYYIKNGVETLESDRVIGSPKVINTNKLGMVTVVYLYKGARAEIKVNVVDRVAPSIPQVVLRKGSEKGKLYKGEWYSGDVYQKYKSTDYSKPGVMGSGIARYEISTDGKNYTPLESDYQLTTTSGAYSYYVRSVDKSGNISQANNYVVNIDNDTPECVLEVKSGEAGVNSWYKSDVTVGFKSTSDKSSEIVTSTVTPNTITASTEGTTVIGTVTDSIGNVGMCELVVKVDKDKPTAKISLTGATATITLTDNYGLSGYGVNTSDSSEPSYTDISGTSTTETYTASEIGTYYVWVKDSAGNINKESFEIDSSSFCSIEPGTNITFSSNKATAPCSGNYKVVAKSGYGGYYAYEYAGNSAVDGCKPDGGGLYTLSPASGTAPLVKFAGIQRSASDTVYIEMGSELVRTVGSGGKHGHCILRSDQGNTTEITTAVAGGKSKLTVDGVVILETKTGDPATQYEGTPCNSSGCNKQGPSVWAAKNSSGYWEKGANGSVTVTYLGP